VDMPSLKAFLLSTEFFIGRLFVRLHSCCQKEIFMPEKWLCGCCAV
jgi:hypothetical protein